MSEPRPMTADEEATMREFAALNDSTRVTMTAIEAAQIIATIDALRSEPLDEGLREAARYVVQLGNQPGLDDDEWEQALDALEAALAAKEPKP